MRVGRGQPGNVPSCEGSCKVADVAGESEMMSVFFNAGMPAIHFHFDLSNSFLHVFSCYSIVVFLSCSPFIQVPSPKIRRDPHMGSKKMH